MKWKNLSKTSCVMIVMFSFLFFYGIVPLLFFDNGTTDTKNLREMSKLVHRLEKEKSELLSRIALLEPKGTADTLSSQNQIVDQLEQNNPESEQFIKPAEVVRGDNQLFPKPITYNTGNVQSSESVLVVGGTDGSGTRRVVQILAQLGVTMVSEDPETYDIHGDIIGGWPTVVTPVLEYTESIAYEPSLLPDKIRTEISFSLQQLLNLAYSDSRKPESKQLAVGGALPKPLNVKVSGVKYGFKAPVSMTLAPFWAYLINDFRMLHVVRDGRDIAFSANQGPVQKFFHSMYKKDEIKLSESAEIKAIRLWSDWNLGLKNWAEEKVKTYSSDNSNNGKSFGYYALHSEDLIDESRDVRYSTLSNLAAWLGSDISDKDLCCIATSGSKFLGSHDRTPNNEVSQNALNTRYGKWRSRLQNAPELAEAIHRIGGPALNSFGYEPLRSLPPINEQNKDTFMQSYINYQEVNRPACTLQPEECLPPVLTKKETFVKADVWAIPNVCTVTQGIDYRGGDLELVTVAMITKDMPNYTECCRKCQHLPGCRHFTIDTISRACYLKSSRGTTVVMGPDSPLVSGDMI